MTTCDRIWLAADYHFAGLYSCRLPMGSMVSAPAMPTPGPGTVRLALIRTGIELFGLDYTRDELFPAIRSAKVCIQPPERVAISTQPRCGYKASEGKYSKMHRLDESIIYREYAHAAGPMTVYLHVPRQLEDVFREVLAAIGYWGQSDSLACCLAVCHAEPEPGTFAVPLKCLPPDRPIRDFFSCFATEFQSGRIAWEEIMPDLATDKSTAIIVDVYVWPLLTIERHRGGRLLLRRSLDLPPVADHGGETIQKKDNSDGQVEVSMFHWEETPGRVEKT